MSDSEDNAPAAPRERPWPWPLRLAGGAMLGQQSLATAIPAWTPEPTLIAVGLVLITGRDGLEFVRAVVGR